MNSTLVKPRLVFFQYKYDEHLPEFLLIHKREHVKCLSQWFDVVVIDKDCDYAQICDEHEPDIAVFESGVKDFHTHRRPNITNTRANPGIPKVGLHRADAFCPARAAFLSDMEHWGIDTYFAIAVTAAEHMPEVSRNLFIWPNFVNPEIFRDYGEWKCIPVLFTGAKFELYPWRQRIIDIVSEHYPSLLCPHPGYEPNSPAFQFMVGERYARTINASAVVPACGTIVKEFVRKHVEIPACRACLVTERSPALEAAGFVDMANCVFADEHNVLGKLEFLFKNPEELQRITQAGYEMVHSRHTVKHRDQIFRWFCLHKAAAPDQRIIQTSPFEPLTLVEASAASRHAHVFSNGLHLRLLRQGDERLWEGRYDEAEGWYLKCLNYLGWMPEAKFRMALCSLYQGDAKAALGWLDPLIEFTVLRCKALDPEPVEWAYHIIALFCSGKTELAARHAAEFLWLRHPELDRARWAAGLLSNRSAPAPSPESLLPSRRSAIHQLPDRTLEDWCAHLRLMLRACGQADLANRIDKPAPLGSDTPGTKSAGLPLDNGPVALQPKPPTARQISANPSLFWGGGSWHRKLRRDVKAYAADLLHRAERKWGYFLPYRFSESRNDEFFGAIRAAAQDAALKTALLIGASRGDAPTEAFLAGAAENQSEPSVLCLSWRNGRRAWSGDRPRPGGRFKWQELADRGLQHRSEVLGQALRQFRQRDHHERFDAILIAGPAGSSELEPGIELAEQLGKASVVLLDSINCRYNQQIYGALLREPHYVLFRQNPGLRGGYAIFKRLSPAPNSHPGGLAQECVGQ